MPPNMMPPVHQAVRRVSRPQKTAWGQRRIWEFAIPSHLTGAVFPC